MLKMNKSMRETRQNLYALPTPALILMTLMMASGAAQAKIPSGDLWGFINHIRPALRDLTVANTAQFPLTLSPVEQNEYTQFYTAEPVFLEKGGQLNDIDIRLSKSLNDHAPFMRFTWQGQCVKLPTIKTHFPQLTLTDVPHGHSENETTSYTSVADANGQSVSFAFAVKQPDCLQQVVIASRD